MSCQRTLAGALLAALVSLSPVTHAEEPEFQLVGTVEPKLVSLSILPRPGYRLHPDAPVVVRLDGSAVELSRKLYQRQDAVDPRAEAPRFELPFRRRGSGAARIDAEVSFYICRASLCRPVVARWSSAL